MNLYRRHRTTFRVLGLAALTAGALGVGAAFTSGTGPAAEAPPVALPGMVCFGHVDVEYGVTSLCPVQPGRVAEVLVRESEAVKAGAVLLRLDDDRAKLRVQEAQAALGGARARLVQVRQLPRQHQLKLAQLQAGLDALKARGSAAKHLCAHKQGLYEQKLLSQADLAAARDQVREMEALLRGEQGRLEELQSHDPALDVRCAEQEVEAREAGLRQAEQGLRECALHAPADGRVLRLLAGPGDMLGVAPKPAAVLFCPEGPRLVRAEVEQDYAHQVAVGQDALVRDDSGAPGQWRGRVDRVADWYTRRRSVLDEPLQPNDVRTLECLITLDPGQPPLRIGQRVRVTIGGKPAE
jgi:multidrug resistance efflux pump